jgi:hypothetical protein
MISFNKWLNIDYKNIFKYEIPKYVYAIKGNKIFYREFNSKARPDILKFKNASKAKKYWEIFATHNVLYLLKNKNYIGNIKPIKVA